MSTPPGYVAKVQPFLVGPTTRKVLLVEGPDDLAVYDRWLTRLAAPDD